MRMDEVVEVDEQMSLGRGRGEADAGGRSFILNNKRYWLCCASIACHLSISFWIFFIFIFWLIISRLAFCKHVQLQCFVAADLCDISSTRF